MRFVDHDGNLVTVYEMNQFKGGLLGSIKQAYADIISSRHVIAQLFWRDFTAQFRQKILGYFWALVSPFLGVVSFLFLVLIGVLNPGKGEIPYTLYVLIGSIVWGYLPGSMNAVSGGLQSQSDLIMRTRIPKLALAISSLANFFYSIFINMITLVVLFLLMGITPSWWIIFYPLLVLPMILLGTALGLILAVLGSIARDLTPLVTQVLTLFMYITPVIYLRSTIKNKLINTLMNWNPLTYFIDVPRSLICVGHAENIKIFLLMFLGTFIFVIIGLRIFYLLEDLVAERL